MVQSPWYSARLYATSVFGNTVYEIDPNNLNNVQDLAVSLKLGSIPGPDGITTDGIGNLFVASSDSLGDGHVYQIDLINNTLTQKTYVYGLDDLAPASGLGSMPEPSSIVLLSIGVIGLFAYVWRKRNRV